MNFLQRIRRLRKKLAHVGACAHTEQQRTRGNTKNNNKQRSDSTRELRKDANGQRCNEENKCRERAEEQLEEDDICPIERVRVWQCVWLGAEDIREATDGRLPGSALSLGTLCVAGFSGGGLGRKGEGIGISALRRKGYKEGGRESGVRHAWSRIRGFGSHSNKIDGDDSRSGKGENDENERATENVVAEIQEELATYRKRQRERERLKLLRRSGTNSRHEDLGGEGNKNLKKGRGGSIDGLIHQMNNSIDAGACLIGRGGDRSKESATLEEEPFSLVFLAGVTALEEEEARARLQEKEQSRREGEGIREGLNQSTPLPSSSLDQL